MSYKSNSELPETVRENLPEHGQEIYRKAFNNAWDEYKEPSERKGDASRKRLLIRLLGMQLRKFMKKTLKGTGSKERLRHTFRI